jgi:hypothetical protein
MFDVALLKSLVVVTENRLVVEQAPHAGEIGPIVIALKVRVYVPMGAATRAETVKEEAPVTTPGVLKMPAGTWVNVVATFAKKKPVG